MKFSGKIMLTVFSAAACFPSAWPETEPPLTLNIIVAAARGNNKELLAMRRRLAVAQALIEENAARPNPSIELERQTPLDAGYQEFKIYQPFALNGRITLAKQTAQAEAAAFSADIAALENEIAAAAKTAYYGFRLAGERIRFEEANLKFSMDMLNSMQLQFQTGQATNADLARAKVETARNKYRLEAAQSKLKAAEAELNCCMGRPPQIPITVADNGMFLNAPSASRDPAFETTLAAALSSRPDLAASALRAEAAETGAALEKRKRIPDLTLGWITGASPEERYSKLAVTLELPLWYRNRGAIARAEAETTARAQDTDSLNLSVRKQIYTAWLARVLAAKRVRAARETVLLVNDLRKTASLDYLSGKSGLAAFYETNRIFIEENLNYLDGLAEYFEKSVELEKAAGSIAAGEL
ncbi:MAG: TolC family protein [Elusimicrobiaceae bacterium]|nr:TolC family protein [Elusimicrobiaceae bacterium]